ncbi:MAG TPA: DUF2809 domain-containing protein [Kofleriaceae bacterium]|nr:DUF2809 domain-containing protein [Kofleriaceae bacterium]
MSRKRAMLVLAAAALALGFVSWLWGALALPGRAVIRGHVGDVAAVALVYAVLALTSARPAVCAAVAAVIALAIELAQQSGGSRGGPAGDLLLGRHFDPWDLVAYAVGIMVAVAVDRSPSPARPASSRR